MRLIVNHTAAAWAILGGIVVLLVVAVTSTNVGAFGIDRIARLFGTHFPALPGFEDFVRLAISCAALMFFPYCQCKRGHVFVDLFAKTMSPSVQRVLDVLSLLLTIFLALFLAYWMTLGAMETKADNALSRVLGWPEWPFYIPGILSLVLWALVAITQLFDSDVESHLESQGPQDA